MLITIPAHILNGTAPTSVLNLDPLLELLRQCGPDAVSLMPPAGADDLPNGPALLAMKNQLAAAGVGMVPGAWTVQARDAVESASWMAQELFEIRALVASLGEAGIGPLVLDWNAPATASVLEQFLEPLLEEAERAGVSIALRLRNGLDLTRGLLRTMASPHLGVCCELWSTGSRHQDSLRKLAALGDRVLVVRPGRCWESGGAPQSTGELAWERVLDTLRQARFTGPVLLDSVRTPVECGAGVGFFRGALAATGGLPSPRTRTATLIEVV